MIRPSAQAISHLIFAAQQERDHLVLIHEAVGEDWPDGFDANDIPLYDILIKYLEEAKLDQKQELDLSGKSLAFVLLPLPAYVQENRKRLSSAELEELKLLYSHLPGQPGPGNQFLE